MTSLAFLAWAILIVGFVLAALGTILPGLPGSAFVVIGVIAHKLLLPESYSWWIVAAITVLAIFSWVADLAGGAMGAKLGGASKYGLIGAAIGGILGLFLGLPGLLIGPFLGAIAGDLYAKRRDLAELLKSGTGAAIGFIFSLIARLVLLVTMGIIVLIAIVV